MTDLISCIIPVYNGERFLREAVASILGQSHESIEVIVVDDGSTDGTAEIARSYGSRVRYVHQDNAGPAKARNHGIDLARGAFVAFLDADDRWHQEKLSRQLGRFRERPELAYSVTLVQNFWEAEVAEERDRLEDHTRAQPIPGYVTDTLMVPKSWMDETGGFDDSFAHGDAADWISRVELKGGVGELLEEVLVYRRLHAENRSRVHATESREEFLRILKGRLDRQRGRAT